MEIKLRALQS